MAVYKQILNLAPTHYESYAKLAELYERMGLVGEALNSLQVAADALNRLGLYTAGTPRPVCCSPAQAQPGPAPTAVPWHSKPPPPAPIW